MAAFWFGLLLVATVWVAIDAGKRDWSNDKFAKSQTVWIVGMVFLAVIVFPIYLFKRGGAPLKESASGALAPSAVGTASLPAPAYNAAGPPPPPPPPPPVEAGPPAGWYADPRGEQRLRYWDGRSW